MENQPNCQSKIVPLIGTSHKLVSMYKQPGNEANHKYELPIEVS